MNTWMWVALLLGIPVLIAAVHSFLRRRRTPSWKIDSSPLPPVARLLPTLLGVTGNDCYRGNAIEPFTNGSLFAPLLEDINRARGTIHLETFVWSAGQLEEKFVEALSAAALRGVEVRLMVDGVGAKERSAGVFDNLRKCGATIEVFNPLTLTSLHRSNIRTHRKLCVVDGRIGYVMGHGISDEWLGDARSPDQFRDTGVRITGPAVHGLQSVFVQGWISERDEFIGGDHVFPELEPTGSVDIGVIASAPDDDYSGVELAFAIGIAAAQHEILIQNPYFAPDRSVVKLLCDAAGRGVSVQLMLPGAHNDSALVRLASRHLYSQLLAAGVRILEFLPSLLHQKVMMVDQQLVRIGSTNFDSRSLALNREADITALDHGLANELREHFLLDAGRAKPITQQTVDNYSMIARAGGAFAYMIHEQL